MTLYVPETNLVLNFTLNQTNLTLGAIYDFILTSQYSHQPIVMSAQATFSNARYTTFQVTFPVGFGDSHKNGIYYYDIKLIGAVDSIEKGLVKIVTEPGGTMGTTNFNAGIDTEERVAEVFYRPNY